MFLRCVSAVAPVGLAATLLLAGCGGSDGSDTERWAGDVCGAANEWAGDVDGALESVAEEGLALDEEDVRMAISRIGEATDELGTAMDELGPPETESGERAREELQALGEAIRGQLDDVERALGGDPAPLEAVATVAAALAAASSRVQVSLDTL